MKDDRLAQALRALAEQDSLCEAPARVEARLLEVVRRGRRTKVLWRSAIAATIVIGGIIGGISAAVSAGRRSPPQVLTGMPAAAAAIPPSTPVLPTAQTRPASPRKRVARPQPVQIAAPEIATEFFSLVDAPPPFERGELVRVLLPASAMRVVGLPVREEHLADPVQADVLIGEEGMARAIRFVSFEP